MNLAGTISLYCFGAPLHMDVAPTFHPPSLKRPRRVPTDDPMETDDRFGDVTKKKSRAIQRRRLRLARRSSNPPELRADVVTAVPFPNTGLAMFGGGPGSGCNPEKGRCGRKPKGDQQVRSEVPAIEQSFEDINRMYRAIDRGVDPTDDIMLGARYGAMHLLKNLAVENRSYLGRGEPYVSKQRKYWQMLIRLESPRTSMADIDTAINMMHVDYDLLEHALMEVGDDDPKRFARLTKMAERFRARLGARKPK